MSEENPSSDPMDVLNADDDVPEPDESKENDPPGEAPEEKTEDDTEEAENVEEEKEEEEKEEETETEEETEEVEEKDDTAPAVSFKAIKDKFPDLFKSFPELKNVITRDRAFTRIFSSVEDATDISVRAKVFDEMTEAIGEGKTDMVLSAIKNDNVKNLEAFASNFLPALHKLDRELYVKVTTPFLKWFVRSIREDGEKAGNSNLVNAAAHISKLVWNSKDIPDDPKEDPKLEEERNKLKEERENFNKSIQERFKGEVFMEGAKGLVSTIEKLIPEDLKLTPLQRKAIIKEAYDQIGATLQKDGAHTTSMDSLWAQANKAKYTGDSKARLVSTYLGRAKRVAPEIIKKLIASEVGGRKKTTKVKIPSSGNPKVVTSRAPVQKLRERGIKSELDFLNEG